MTLRVYTQTQLEEWLEREPDAYIGAMQVTAMRLDTFMSIFSSGEAIPLSSLDEGKAHIKEGATALYKGSLQDDRYIALQDHRKRVLQAHIKLMSLSGTVDECRKDKLQDITRSEAECVD